MAGLMWAPLRPPTTYTARVTATPQTMATCHSPDWAPRSTAGWTAGAWKTKGTQRELGDPGHGDRRAGHDHDTGGGPRRRPRPLLPDAGAEHLGAADVLPDWHRHPPPDAAPCPGRGRASRHAR